MKRRIKSVLVFLLIAALMASFAPVIPVAAADTDMGEAFLAVVEHKTTVPAGYTPIYNREDLQKVRENLAGNYILMNDIDLYYEAWTPIGLSGSSALPTGEGTFSGVFDGNGYEIRSLDISVKDTSSAYIFVGLFGVVSGEVKNLSVSGTALAVGSQNVWAGGITGYVTDSGKLTNCVGRVDVIASGASAYAGGIAGELLGSAAYLMNYGAVSAANAGGIVAVARGASLYECRNLGEVNASSLAGATAGGIAAYVYGAESLIERCSNTGTIEASSSMGTVSRVGGIVGKLTGTVTECWNSGNVKGKTLYNTRETIYTYVAGIAGVIDDGVITKSFNTGTISGIAEHTYKNGAPNFYYVYTYCVVGGVVGNAINADVTNCFNFGNISGNAKLYSTYRNVSYVMTGGIIAWGGVRTGALLNAQNLYNAGTISASTASGSDAFNYKGGIAGYTNVEGTGMIALSNCYWLAPTASSSIGQKNGSVTETRVSALTDEQIKNQDSFEGFPFGYTWTMGGDAEYEYPELVDLTYRTTNDICSHDAYGAWTETKPATCRENGEEMCECSICGSRRYRITEGHSFGVWENVDESNHKHICLVCGKEETAAHTWDEGEVTTEPTHIEFGEKTYTCTACGATKTEQADKMPEHTYGEWEKYDEMQHKHTCACGNVQYADHTWDEGKITTPATATSTGVRTYTCIMCGERKTEIIPVWSAARKKPQLTHGVTAK